MHARTFLPIPFPPTLAFRPAAGRRAVPCVVGDLAVELDEAVRLPENRLWHHSVARVAEQEAAVETEVAPGAFKQPVHHLGTDDVVREFRHLTVHEPHLVEVGRFELGVLGAEEPPDGVTRILRSDLQKRHVVGDDDARHMHMCGMPIFPFGIGEFEGLHVKPFVGELHEVPRLAVLPAPEWVLAGVASEDLARVLLVAPAPGAREVLNLLSPVPVHNAGYQDESQRDEHREGQRRWNTLTHSTHHNGSTRPRAASEEPAPHYRVSAERYSAE